MLIAGSGCLARSGSGAATGKASVDPGGWRRDEIIEAAQASDSLVLLGHLYQRFSRTEGTDCLVCTRRVWLANKITTTVEEDVEDSKVEDRRRNLKK